jgi:hypothetical protein
VHSGSAYHGHYYAFLRTSTASDWYKFNDTSVTTATVQEAADDNFSSSGSWSNGYMLVYVRQTDAHQIYQRIDDSQIPRHLRDYFKQGDESPNTRSVEISVADESCVRQNCASGKTGFECKPLHKTATFSRDCDTNATVYQKFAELFGIPVDEMRLWNAHTLFAPYTVFENTTTSLFHCCYKTLFLQRKSAAEKVRLDRMFVHFVKFYHPSLERPLQYLGAFPASNTDPVSVIFPKVCDLLGFPEGTRFTVYEEVGANARLMQSVLATSSHYFVGTVILQLEPGVPLPPTTYAWSTTPAFQEDSTATKEDESVFTGLKVVRAPASAHESIDKFLTGSVEAILFIFESPDSPVVRVSFSTGMSVDAFKKFLADALNIEFDSKNDSFLVYKGDTADPDRPSHYPISSTHSGEIAYQFGSKKLYRIFVRVVRGISESKLSSFVDLPIEFSEDGYTVKRALRIYVPWQAHLSDIRRQLVEREIIPDSPNLRFETVHSHTFGNTVIHTSYRPQHWETLRIDLVPDDQQQPGTRLLEGAFMIQSSYFEATGNPFMFSLRPGEAVPEFSVRLRDALKMSEAQFKKVNLMVSREKPTSAAAGVALKGSTTVEELIALLGSGQLRLSVVLPSMSSSHSHKRDESIKIYN